jgi:hypothetical protein
VYSNPVLVYQLSLFDAAPDLLQVLKMCTQEKETGKLETPS